jgi:LAO/AO transport system kinase
MITLDDLAEGGKPALARTLSVIERDEAQADVAALLDDAYSHARAHVIGLTGPPGVGKSSLLAALIPRWRALGRTIGVIAIDPSSRRTGGALLGDRARLKTDPDDQGVFVRSMAARDKLGGLGPQTLAACVLMSALFDLVVIETVGVGQSETDIEGLADTVGFCIQPASGDSLQFMKAGIVEIPHLCIVTKADMGPAAERAVSDASGALSLAEATHDGWTIPVMAASSSTGLGLDRVITSLDDHYRHLKATQSAQDRKLRAQAWINEAIRDRFGRFGLQRAAAIELPSGLGPFARLAAISKILAS